MALDVRLTRDVNERWGFDLMGGADEEMPLTIQKLQPSSPAARAGLQNGDVILAINNEEAIDFTHEEASRKIAECSDTLNMGLMRGLYDPVLDDQEPIFYEPGDLDPDSQPTEVPFKVQRFVEPEDIGSTLIDYGTNNDPLGTPFDPSVLLSESRSLTASPHVNLTKPYRPFSTEPVLEVPPLEDPIILNPNYKDQFGESPVDINPDYILNAHNKDGLLGPKYKLPISEQYDPDGTRKAKNVEVDSMLSKYTNMEMLSKKSVTSKETVIKTSEKDVHITESSCTGVKIDKSITKDESSQESLSKERKESLKVTTEEISSLKKDVKITEKHEMVAEDIEEKMINEELKYIEKMKQDIDIAQIEKTAMSVVDDSIDRAVSVAEEIKKEMEEELTTDTKEKSEQIIYESEEIARSSKSETKRKESARVIEIESKKTAKDSDSEVIEKRVSKQEYEDIQQEVVRKAQDEEILQKVAKKDTKESIESKSEQFEEKVIKEMPQPKDLLKESLAQEAMQSESKGEFRQFTKTVTSGTSDKTGAQQRTYALGLQTIPNIRGVVHSSYHYDLLLRTFFIHLTDVMVALSRFLLSQPVFNTKSVETRNTVSQTQMYESDVKDIRKGEHEVIESVKKVEKQKIDESKKKVESKQEITEVLHKAEKDTKVQEKIIERRQLITPVEEIQVKSQDKIQMAENKQEIKAEEKKLVSGAQMAQRTEKKLTKEMTQKMDALISEFQSVAVEEDNKEILERNRRSRSRSRSQIEEEVAKESDPLEWLHKVDSRRASQEISEERLSKKEYSSSETFEKKHFEKVEMQDVKHKKTKTPKQLYRAIVEAHVYTNKDVIFEDAAEFSETSSVQSAEEINTAVEAFETISAENVALESAMQQLEKAKIVEESQELVKVQAQSKAAVHKIDQSVHESTDIKHEEIKKETAIKSADVQEVILQESREIIEPVVEIKEIETIKKESAAVDINESLSIAESTKVNILESKSEFAVQQIEESAKITEESQALLKAQAQSQAVIHKLEKIVHESTDMKHEETKKETAIKTAEIQEVILQESREIIEPVVEIKEKETLKKESASININESLSIAESTKIDVLESKSEFAVQQIKETAKIVEETHEVLKAKAQSEATIQKIEETVYESTDIKLEEIKKETAKQTADLQEVIIQETREVIEPIVEIKETVKKQSAALDIKESLSVAESSEISILESKSDFSRMETKKESVGIIEEDYEKSTAIESKAKIIEKAAPQIEEVTEKVVVRPHYKRDEEYAALKIVKEVETEIDTPKEIVEVEEAVVKKIEITKLDLNAAKESLVESDEALITTADLDSEKSFFMGSDTENSLSKKIDVSSISNQAESVSVHSYKSESHISEDVVQASSFTARSVDKSLTLQTDLQRQDSQSPPSTINTPTPSTVPPTPQTEEYVFKLKIALPKSRESTPVPRDCSLTPEDEDPHIVKKKLIPHIETKVEEKIVYDPPLPTPPAGDKLQSPIFKTPGLFGGASKPIYKIKFPPVYRKPGLFGGADNPEYSKEEIREIERKSSLLASAIDETIKSIEEYKEEVGLEKKKDINIKEYKEEKVSKSYSKKIVTESKQNGIELNAVTVTEELITTNGDVSLTNGINDSTVKIVEVMTEEANVAEKEALPKEVKVEIENKEVVKKETSDEIAKKEVLKEDASIVTKKKEVIKEEINTRENKEVSETVTQKDNVETESAKIEVHREKKEVVKEEQGIQTAKKEVVKEEINIKNESVGVSEEDNFQTESAEIEVQREKSETHVKINVEKPEAKIVEVKELDHKESNKYIETSETGAAIIGTPMVKEKKESEKKDPMLGYRPVVFDPQSIQKRAAPNVVIELPTPQEGRQSPYITESGDIMGTIQGIVDGLEEPVMDPEIAKELGKPGISEEKIAELISGEAEMLREAHVMGLSRVLTSHMHRADDSVDFQKIKPMIDSLKDSEVLKALNDDLARQKEEQKKKEEKKWTTFLQKPTRPVPKAKFGYHGWTEAEQALVLEPYKVKIVKQAKPKVAPDYKPEDFDTGPLPWEQRAELDASLPPVEPEEPILIPEVPEYLEAVDPTKESEVPDLEDTGIPLPPPKEPTPPPEIEQTQEEQPPEQQEPDVQEVVEQVVEEEKQETGTDMENRLADQLVRSVQSMVDPNASVEQQLAQMRAQLAALAQLPEVIQQSLEMVSKQLNKMGQQEAEISMSASHKESHSYQEVEVTQNHVTGSTQDGIVTENNEQIQNYEAPQQHNVGKVTIEEMDENMEIGEIGGQQVMQRDPRILQTPQPQQEMRMQTPVSEEDLRMEKMKKTQQQQSRQESEARQLKQRPTPRVGKPKRVFGPPDPDCRPVVLPGGRRWRNTDDVYNEQKIKEMFEAQSEVIKGNAIGINFMKYEKPPVSLDHLQNSETYKLIHEMDQKPLKRVEMRTPVIAEADYRERCRSMTPGGDKKHLQIPQQFHP